MSGQPPPYEEIAAGEPGLQGPSSALTVQLRVWHDRSEGRSPANNDAFATLFRNHDLQKWEVVPLEVDGITGLSCHDQYVPVEVRFRHRMWAFNDPGEHPMADVRELFYKVAPQFIYQFFIQIRSTPHNLNIYPVDVPAEFYSRYSHAYTLNRLSIRVNTFFVPGPATNNDAQSWLRDAVNTAANVLEILAAIVSIYLMYLRDQNERNQNGTPDIQGMAHGAHFLNVDVPHEFGELRMLFQQFTQPNRHDAAQSAVPIADVSAALNAAADPLQQYLRLANRMESRLTKLETNQTLSNQDLYELVQDSHNAALHFSTLKQAVRPLVRLLDENYSAIIETYKSNRVKCATTGAVLAAVAILLWWNPAGWAAVGAYGLGGAAVGGVAGAGAHCMLDTERGKAFERKDRVREFDVAIKELDMCANQAREAIAALFCAQVMQKPLDDSLPEHHRRALLATLGIDANALHSPDYSQELLRDRVSRLLECNRKLGASQKRVLADANFELQTTEQAA